MAETAYAELHCHSNFSFLDGASHPEELAEEAHRLGLSPASRSPTTTGSTGWCGSRWRPAARPPDGLRRRADPRRPDAHPTGTPTRRGSTSLLIAEGPAGYAALARAISAAQMRGEKGAPRHTLADLADARAGRRGSC